MMKTLKTKEKKKAENPEEFQLPLTEHLEELRRKIIVCLLSVAITSVVAYFFSDYLLQYLTLPLRKFFPELKLVFIKPTEAFLTYLKASLITGFFVSIPIIIYEIWSFVSPGLYSYEKKYTLAVVLPSIILFFSGLAFCFFLVIPYGLKFLIGSFSYSLSPMISIREYLSFLFMLLVGFGLAFTSPVFLVILSVLGIINFSQLKAFNPYAVVVIFALSAIITPPDVFTQVILALPLIILYEITLFIVWLIERKQGNEQ